ncbi:hypothetical protein KXV95_008208, partial [Aspergillus fumigatus]
FIGWLEAKDLFALAVLAYWAILLKYMQTSWMMMGWDEHVLAGVLAFLPEEHRRWARWPVECIFGDRQPVIV